MFHISKTILFSENTVRSLLGYTPPSRFVSVLAGSQTSPYMAGVKRRKMQHISSKTYCMNFLFFDMEGLSYIDSKEKVPLQRDLF